MVQNGEALKPDETHHDVHATCAGGPLVKSGQLHVADGFRPSGKNDVSTKRRPARICATRSALSVPMYSPSFAFSTVTLLETSTTLGRGRFASPASSRMLPGIETRARFVVSAQATTVA